MGPMTEVELTLIGVHGEKAHRPAVPTLPAPKPPLAAPPLQERSDTSAPRKQTRVVSASAAPESSLFFNTPVKAKETPTVRVSTAAFTAPPEPFASIAPASTTAAAPTAGPSPTTASVSAAAGPVRGRGRRGGLALWLRAALPLALPALCVLVALRRFLPAVLVAAGAVGAAWAAWSLRRARYWRRRGVNGPAPAPIVGNLWPLLRLRVGPGEFMAQLYRFAPDSPVVGFFILDKPCLVVRDPALAKRILVTDYACFSSRYASASVAVDPAGASNLFSARGRCWAFTRRALSPTFTGSRLRAMFDAMTRHTAALADHVQAASADPRRPLKTKDAVARALTDLVAECLFGLESNALRDGGAASVRAHARRIFGFSPRRAFEILAAFFVPALIAPGRVQFFHRGSSDFFERLFKEIMQHRRAEAFARGDAMDEMLAMQRKAAERIATGPNDGPEAVPAIVATDEHVVGQAMVYFTAGFETSATAVCTTLYELARHPAEQVRVRAEVREAVRRHGGLTYEALADAPLLHMAVTEALRLYPSLPYLDRTCLRDYELLPGAGGARGLVLEAGTPVFIPVMAMQRDERLFPDANAFRPERWAPGASPQPPLFLSFGGGPRTCIGMRFALLAVKLTLAQLLLRFEVAPCADTPNSLVVSPFSLFLKFFGGIPLQFNALAPRGEDGGEGEDRGKGEDSGEGEDGTARETGSCRSNGE